MPYALKLQSSFAGGVREGLDTAVVQEAPAVEDRGRHAGGLRPTGDRPAHGRRGLQVLGAGLELRGRGRGQRATADVVDELRVHVMQAPEDAQARPLAGTRDADAHPPVPPRTRTLAV